MKLIRSDRKALFAFMAPAILVMILFFVIPVIYVIVVSFLEWNGISAPAFNNLKNYALLMKDKSFSRSVINNIIWALVAGFIQVPLAMVMAIILSRKPKGWKFFRTVYFFPQVISGIALATLWRAIYNAEHGMLNGLLRAVGLGAAAKDWLGTIQTAFPAVLIYWVFYIGYYMVIMMADITTIDTSYYEAATIDGATDFQQAIYITIPLIKKTSLLTCVTLASVMGLRQFEQVYMLTNGQPANTTSTIVLYMYKKMQNANYGIASASAVILILVGVIFIICIRKLFEGRGDRPPVVKSVRRAVK
ncbi:MAG: sugar ABC transporter permease [Oscillospiraceae bacterium]|nr:sugar ABC transporter permease [Oscillospiraceae bacterium]